MGKVRKYIDMIVDNGNTEDMICLRDMLSDLVYMLKDENYEKYEKYKNKLYGMAYKYEIDEELAYEIVEDMEPLGEYWNMETIKNVIGNDNHKLCDMYVVMNSLVNDYQEVVKPDDVATYIKMAHAWLDDVDGKEHKLWKYFVE